MRGSRILLLGREILVGSGLAFGLGGWICSLLPVWRRLQSGNVPEGTIWETERYRKELHFGGSCKGEAARKGCTSREAFGSIGRPAEVIGFPFGEDRPEVRFSDQMEGDPQSQGCGTGVAVKRFFGARLVAGSFGASPRSGVWEPREGDDFGWNFLGVFRVRALPGPSTWYLVPGT